nr:MAG TPA: hypothetical protein [Caudoviricetes sp.]
MSGHDLKKISTKYGIFLFLNCNVSTFARDSHLSWTSLQTLRISSWTWKIWEL